MHSSDFIWWTLGSPPHTGQLNAVIKAALDLLECDNTESAKALLRAFSSDLFNESKGTHAIEYGRMGDPYDYAFKNIELIHCVCLTDYDALPVGQRECEG